MTRSFSGWTSLSLVSLALCAGSCKSSSDTEQPLREGGLPSSPEADGGWGGQDGEDDFRPELIPPPRTPRPATAGSDAGVDAGAPATAGGTGGSAVAGSGGASASGGGAGASGGGSDGESGSPANDGGPPPEPEDDAGVEPPDPPACTTLACFCQRVCERGTALACGEDAPFEDCVGLCVKPKAGCENEQLALHRCKAELPDDGYFCDEFFLVFDTRGCEAELATFTDCSAGN